MKLHLLLFLQIELGSTNVRVGSTIFGAREPKNPNNETKGNIDSEVNPQSSNKSNTRSTDNSQGNTASVSKTEETLSQMSLGTS
jgi:hypothetical protein